MRQIAHSHINRVSAEILDVAMIEPVVLTKYGKEKLYVLAARDHHRMRGNRGKAVNVCCDYRVARRTGRVRSGAIFSRPTDCAGLVKRS